MVKWNTPDVFLTVEIGSIPDDFSQVIHLQTGPKLDWIHRPAMCITWDFLTPSSFVYGCILTWFLWGHWMWQSRSYLLLNDIGLQCGCSKNSICKILLPMCLLFCLLCHTVQLYPHLFVQLLSYSRPKSFDEQVNGNTQESQSFTLADTRLASSFNILKTSSLHKQISKSPLYCQLQHNSAFCSHMEIDPIYRREKKVARG